MTGNIVDRVSYSGDLGSNPWLAIEAHWVCMAIVKHSLNVLHALETLHKITITHVGLEAVFLYTDQYCLKDTKDKFHQAT